mmetsp:Transcript_14779/g.37536  ORF Transcript_14779/g.37536 Transcript_14779/m.37536 type:complete len:207 (-) Transcript_14779:1784-2404(-)
MTTPNQRGMMPSTSGSADPRMASAASAMFCRTRTCVKDAIENRKGSADTPAALVRITPSATPAAAVEGVDATARPTSAVASAGASLMPSPTMSTPPWLCSRRRCISCSFASGLRPARTSFAASPSLSAIALALPGLSPDSITTSRPADRTAAMAWPLDSCGRSWKWKACMLATCPPAICSNTDTTSPALEGLTAASVRAAENMLAL